MSSSDSHKHHNAALQSCDKQFCSQCQSIGQQFYSYTAIMKLTFLTRPLPISDSVWLLVDLPALLEVVPKCQHASTTQSVCNQQVSAPEEGLPEDLHPEQKRFTRLGEHVILRVNSVCSSAPEKRERFYLQKNSYKKNKHYFCTVFQDGLPRIKYTAYIQTANVRPVYFTLTRARDKHCHSSNTSIIKSKTPPTVTKQHPKQTGPLPNHKTSS